MDKKHLEMLIANTIDKLGMDHLMRTAGSWVDGVQGEERAFLKSLEWTEVTEEAKESGVAFGDCQYYRSYISEDSGLTGYEAFALVEDLKLSELAQVRIVEGAHGPEMQAPDIQPRETTVVHLIEGTHEGCRVIYTWYPGRMTKNVPLGQATVKLGTHH